ncbi:hypothetical protein CBR_g48451 [Chara braunii]|uniref:Uncharacterized protein n=1 Tax=Chara braunii TaxID=69332 RepID=A0A388M2Y4_CHABU|nr:hypothetical protein CBR_g48451 [Chara braunii]|eukprot:GBG88839.1 hypothetical protein CBR_g48451 [Chara braunii]
MKSLSPDSYFTTHGRSGGSLGKTTLDKNLLGKRKLDETSRERKAKSDLVAVAAEAAAGVDHGFLEEAGGVVQGVEDNNVENVEDKRKERQGLEGEEEEGRDKENEVVTRPPGTHYDFKPPSSPLTRGGFALCVGVQNPHKHQSSGDQNGGGNLTALAACTGPGSGPVCSSVPGSGCGPVSGPASDPLSGPGLVFGPGSGYGGKQLQKGLVGCVWNESSGEFNLATPKRGQEEERVRPLSKTPQMRSRSSSLKIVDDSDYSIGSSPISALFGKPVESSMLLAGAPSQSLLKLEVGRNSSSFQEASMPQADAEKTMAADGSGGSYAGLMNEPTNGHHPASQSSEDCSHLHPCSTLSCPSGGAGIQPGTNALMMTTSGAHSAKKELLVEAKSAVRWKRRLSFGQRYSPREGSKSSLGESNRLSPVFTFIHRDDLLSAASMIAPQTPNGSLVAGQSVSATPKGGSGSPSFELLKYPQGASRTPATPNSRPGNSSLVRSSPSSFTSSLSPSPRDSSRLDTPLSWTSATDKHIDHCKQHRNFEKPISSPTQLRELIGGDGIRGHFAESSSQAQSASTSTCTSPSPFTPDHKTGMRERWMENWNKRTVMEAGKENQILSSNIACSIVVPTTPLEASTEEAGKVTTQLVKEDLADVVVPTTPLDPRGHLTGHRASRTSRWISDEREDEMMPCVVDLDNQAEGARSILHGREEVMVNCVGRKGSARQGSVSHTIELEIGQNGGLPKDFSLGARSLLHERDSAEEEMADPGVDDDSKRSRCGSQQREADMVTNLGMYSDSEGGERSQVSQKRNEATSECSCIQLNKGLACPSIFPSMTSSQSLFSEKEGAPQNPSCTHEPLQAPVKHHSPHVDWQQTPPFSKPPTVDFLEAAGVSCCGYHSNGGRGVFSEDSMARMVDHGATQCEILSSPCIAVQDVAVQPWDDAESQFLFSSRIPYKQQLVHPLHLQGYMISDCDGIQKLVHAASRRPRVCRNNDYNGHRNCWPSKQKVASSILGGTTTQLSTRQAEHCEFFDSRKWTMATKDAKI